MIEAKVFHERRVICQQCPHWKNVCLKGHGLNSPLGCPEKRFSPVEGAGYLEDRPAVQPQAEGIIPCCGGLPAEEVKEFSYIEAMAQLVRDLKVWKEAGFPFTDEAGYEARLAVCKACPGGFYRFFQCRACKCLVFSKAKVKTAACPGGYWPPA